MDCKQKKKNTWDLYVMLTGNAIEMNNTQKKITTFYFNITKDLYSMIIYVNS